MYHPVKLAAMEVHPAPPYYAKEMKCRIGSVLMLRVPTRRTLTGRKTRASFLRNWSRGVVLA